MGVNAIGQIVVGRDPLPGGIAQRVGNGPVRGQPQVVAGADSTSIINRPAGGRGPPTPDRRHSHRSSSGIHFVTSP
jgi:hypothetical protein